MRAMVCERDGHEDGKFMAPGEHQSKSSTTSNPNGLPGKQGRHSAADFSGNLESLRRDANLDAEARRGGVGAVGPERIRIVRHRRFKAPTRSDPKPNFENGLALSGEKTHQHSTLAAE